MLTLVRQMLPSVVALLGSGCSAELPTRENFDIDYQII